MTRNPSMQTPHVVLFPSPGMGHLIPVAELAGRLVAHHNLTATLVAFPEDLNHHSSLPTAVSAVSLPSAAPLVGSLPADAGILARISLVMADSVPALRDILLTLQRKARLVALILDLFGGDSLSMAKEVGVPAYLFYTSNISFLFFMLRLRVLNETMGFELLLKKIIGPNSDQNSRLAKEFSLLVHHARHYDRVDGILVNSFEDIEADIADSLKQRSDGKPPIWPIGPLTRKRSISGPAQAYQDCMGWLEGQPGGSVLFLCFGSGGTLSWRQTRELAFGLEMSGQSFLWVLRPPCDGDPSKAFFGLESNDDPLEFLPEGFVERTKERGIVVPWWAPQLEVLGHGATGGFLSHCGWNSTLESVVHGVPMIAWPLYAEQRMTQALLVECVKVAMRLEVGEDGVVRREEVAKVVKELMEGEGGKAVRRRMREMQAAAAKAVGKGGSSCKAMEEVVELFHGSAKQP